MSQKDITSKNNSYPNKTKEVDMEMRERPLVSVPENDFIMDNKKLQWNFMLKSMSLLFFYQLVIICVAYYYLVNEIEYKNFLRNFTQINAYTIVSLCIVFLIYLISAIFKKFVRYVQILLIIALFVLVSYLVGFTVNYRKKHDYDDYDRIISVLLCFFSAVTGNLIALIFSRKYIALNIAVVVALIVWVSGEIILTLGFRQHFYYLWLYIIFFFTTLILTAYYSYDLEMMITRRSHTYQTSYWYNGFIDLQTDIFGVFWIDLLKKNPYGESVDTQKELQNDKQTPIHITVEEAEKGKGVGVGNSNVTVSDQQIMKNLNFQFNIERRFFKLFLQLELSIKIIMKSVQRNNKINFSLENFVTISLIGKGNYGKVVLVKHTHNGELYALKILKKSNLLTNKQRQHVETEKDILTKIPSHPFIVNLYSTFQTQRKLFFVFEFCSGGELFSLLQKYKRLPQNMARFYSAQIVLALEFLHQHKILYRDLKPENILIQNDGYLKLVDFGLSKNNLKNKTSTICGTPEYIAPEILLKENYSKEVDWWALGCLIYEMIIGIPPFYSENRFELFELIRYKEPHFPSGLSSSTICIITNLLNKNPKKRLGYCRDAREVKEHSWFKGIEWDDVYQKKFEALYVPSNSQNGLENFSPQFTKCEPYSCETDSSQLGSFQDFSWTGSPICLYKLNQFSLFLNNENSPYL